MVLAAAGAAYFFPLVLALAPVAVNLAGEGYLKVGVALQLVASDAGGHGGSTGPSGAKATDLITPRSPRRSRPTSRGPRDALKEALEEKIIEAYHGEVMGIYYTEYITQ